MNHRLVLNHLPLLFGAFIDLLCLFTTNVEPVYLHRMMMQGKKKSEAIKSSHEFMKT